MTAKHLLVLTAAILSPPLAAQDVESDDSNEGANASQVPTTAPIIVTGEQEKQRKVFAGSRIPRRQVFNAPGIATSTGTRGLVPQSGMDPANSIRKIKRNECRSDDPLISERVACLLLDAENALSSEDYGRARDLLAHVTLSEEFTPHERLAAAEWQYQLAGMLGDDASRETVLEQMIATGAMSGSRELQARRALISMALKSDRRVLARERLVELDQLGAADARLLANLAVLTREQEAGDAATIMRRAIAAREAKNRFVPKSWQDFVKSGKQ